jgi:lipid-binding SYLF domain-containing protein
VLKEARGVAFLFTYKVGVFASVSGGTGVVMRRLPGSNAWGPPVAIGLGGGGGGLDFGVNKTQQLVVLRSDEAVEAFMKPSAKLSIGLNIAAGPVGRQIEEAGHISKDKAVNAFTYALTQGIFAGVGVQGMFVKEREEENRRFYGLDAKRAAVELSKTPLSDCPEAATKLQVRID